MLLLGIDLGTSSVKVSVIDSETTRILASAQFPETEAPIIALYPGWAEQSPELWWQYVQSAILKCHKTNLYNPLDISSIGIAYQMHGLVMLDKNQQVLRNSIIWCDSRAVDIGAKAFEAIGEEKCLSTLLNSPGNFTASKLAWVKENEPEIFEECACIMLPGDFIAMKLTGTITTSISALSEGMFFDFQHNRLSEEVMAYFDFSPDLFSQIQPVFSIHGTVLNSVAYNLNLSKQVPVTYKAGDQPNNALSLNVLEPGEVAATAGTSGVIYGVSDVLKYDKQSRVNTFAHVNYSDKEKRLGMLLCINGTGSMYRWAKNNFNAGLSYQQMNAAAKLAPLGSNNLRVLPFGNGAERMLNNRLPGVHFHNIDLNLHTKEHLFRAVQEGISFSFRYGLDIMRENGVNPTVIRAGKSNLFLSELFTESFVEATGVTVELYDNDGSVGAAIGAGIGAGTYKIASEAFQNIKSITQLHPSGSNITEEIYQDWKYLLNRQLGNS